MTGHVPQPGIFALGTPAHAYLEFDLRDGADGAAPLAALARLANEGSLDDLPDPIVGANVVIGLRPRLCESLCPAALPAATHDFDEAIVGDDGFTMPGTQHDLIVWISGAAYDHVFDLSHAVCDLVGQSAELVSDTRGWPYQHDRDLTGFVDGTENPPISEALDVAVVGPRRAGAGSSVLLFQHWVHDTRAWLALSTKAQETVMGRTKARSVELEDKAETSHVARTDQDEVGHIFRRNMPYGTVADHGTVFVGFAGSQQPLEEMLRRMAGTDGQPRDALTRFTTPLTGSYYVIPSMQILAALAGTETGTT